MSCVIAEVFHCVSDVEGCAGNDSVLLEQFESFKKRQIIRQFSEFKIYPCCFLLYFLVFSFLDS
jgi:hypothetical protein